MQNYLNHYFYAVLCSSYPLLFCKVVHPVQGALLGFLVRHTQDVVRLEVLRCKMRFECSNTREVRLDTILCLPIPSPFTYIYIYIYSESNEKLSSSSIQICLLHKQFGRTWSPWEDINAALDRAQGELEAQGGTVWWRWKGRRQRIATCEPGECDVV